MLPCFIFNAILFVISKASIDKDQDRYLKERNLKCGIVTKAKNRGASSRVINGRPSLHTYPWMVHIVLKMFKDENLISSSDERIGLMDSEGFFISDKAILTCGHCVCWDKNADEVFPFPRTCGPENAMGGNLSLIHI